MSGLGRLLDRLPALYRPEPGDADLVSGFLRAVADSMEEARRDGADVLQSRWWAYADRAAFHPFFALSKRLDPSLDEEDFPYVHDLARVAALLPLPPREAPPAYRETVEAFRLRIRRIVDLHRGGLGTVRAIRRMVEAELPLVPHASAERHDRPFLVEERPPSPQAVDVADPDAVDGMVGPMMRWTLTNLGVEPQIPTVYVHGVAPVADQVGPTADPVLELYRAGGAHPRVGLAFGGTVAPGQTLRVRPTYASWLGGGEGALRAESLPVNHLDADPTAPGPWSAVEDGPDAAIVALAATQDLSVWAADDGGTLHRFDGSAWTEALDDLGVVHGLLADGDQLLIATDDGVSRMELHPPEGVDRSAESVAGLPGPARALLRDPLGDLWVAGDGAVRRRTPSGTVTTTPLLDGDGSPIPVHALALDGDRGLLVGSELGLILLRPATGEWFWYGGEAFTEQVEAWHRVDASTAADGLPTAESVFLPPVRAVLRGPDSSIWIGTEQGVARYIAREPLTPSGRARELDLVFQTLIEAFPDLAPRSVRAIAADARGVVWLATEGGLHRFDGRDWWQNRAEGGWVQMGRADSLYPAGRDPEPRGAWRFDRAGGRWQRYDLARAAWSDFTDPPRATAEGAANAILWTDGALAELGTWDGTQFNVDGPAPEGALRVRYKPAEDRIVDGGIPAVPRLPTGASVWRYLTLEDGETDPERATPWWTQEGRLVHASGATAFTTEAPPPGRFDREVPPPPSDYDESIYAFLPAARVRFEWAARQPRRVLVRLLSLADLAPLDPAILDRVWSGILRVRPVGVRATLAVDQQIVRQSDGDA